MQLASKFENARRKVRREQGHRHLLHRRSPIMRVNHLLYARARLPIHIGNILHPMREVPVGGRVLGFEVNQRVVPVDAACISTQFVDLIWRSKVGKRRTSRAALLASRRLLEQASVWLRHTRTLWRTPSILPVTLRRITCSWTVSVSLFISVRSID